MSIYTIYHILQFCVELAFFLSVCIFHWCIYMNDCTLYVFGIVPSLNYSFTDRVPPYQGSNLHFLTSIYLLLVGDCHHLRVNYGVSFCKLHFSLAHPVRFTDAHDVYTFPLHLSCYLCDVATSVKLSYIPVTNLQGTFRVHQ